MTLIATPGGMLDLSRPDPAVFRLAWVAQALAHEPRWKPFAVRWSVGDHSLLVTDILADDGEREEVQLLGLLHDSPEGVTGDIQAPYKRYLGISDADAYLMHAAWRGLTGLPMPRDGGAVHAADQLAAAIEAWGLLPHEYAREIAPQPPDRFARYVSRLSPTSRPTHRFIARFRALHGSIRQEVAG